MKKAFIGVLLLGHGDEHVGRPRRSGEQGWFSWVGPRVGLTIDPDQIHFGGPRGFRAISPNTSGSNRISKSESGDDLRSLPFNLDGHYRFASTWDVWTPYLGGGPGIFCRERRFKGRKW